MNLGFPEAAGMIPNPDEFLNSQQQQQQQQQTHYYIMNPRANFNSPNNRISYYTADPQRRKQLEYTGRRLVPAASYLGVLLCLAASLLILPLILPPLPPPPLMLLLLLPIGILGMLMVLAFMPSNHTKDISSSSSHTYF